jgi:hypothetical protein
VVGIAIYLGIILVVGPLVNSALAGSAGDKHAKVHPAFPDGTVRLIAVLFATGAMLTLGKEVWGRRNPTEAWGKGAEGERLTAKALDPLKTDGHILLNDLRIPGKRSNVDHILIGPTGVYVIESKNYSGKVRITRRTVTLNGRHRDRDIREVLREAELVETVLAGRPEAVVVRPLLWLHAAEVTGSMFSEPVVQGVRIGSSRKLTAWIRGQARVLSQGDVQAIAGTLSSSLGRKDQVARPPLQPAAPAWPDASPEAPGARGSPCTCGGVFVVRSRRSDGARFLGCSRFPKCRNTRQL